MHISNYRVLKFFPFAVGTSLIIKMASNESYFILSKDFSYRAQLSELFRTLFRLSFLWECGKCFLLVVFTRFRKRALSMK